MDFKNIKRIPEIFEYELIIDLEEINYRLHIIDYIDERKITGMFLEKNMDGYVNRIYLCYEERPTNLDAQYYPLYEFKKGNKYLGVVFYWSDFNY